MERTDILELMSTLKLYGMRAAYDEVMTTGIKRRHEPPRIVGDLLSAEIAEKQPRSDRCYRLNVHNNPRCLGSRSRSHHQRGGTLPLTASTSSALRGSARSCRLSLWRSMEECR